MKKVSVSFKRLIEDAVLPRYMTPRAAGMDLCSIKRAILLVNHILLIPIGFAMSLPPGFEAQIRPRSGLAVKHGITVVNSPGTIDADYRGEVKVALINHGTRTFTINPGDRIAQMVIAPVCQAKIQIVTKLDRTSRNSGGFGSTGV